MPKAAQTWNSVYYVSTDAFHTSVKIFIASKAMYWLYELPVVHLVLFPYKMGIMM